MRSILINQRYWTRSKQVLKKERLTWGDIFTIERAILELQPPETIRRRAWSLRDRYRVVVGEHAYAEYLGSSPPDPAGAATTPEALRTDLDQLLSEFHWLYQITPIREGVRNRISKDILQGMTVALAILLGLMALDHYLGGRTNLSTIWMILFMGAIGAFVSLQHRIQSIPTTGDEILNILALEGGWLNVFLAPISGSVFAFVLYLTFSAGFIQGALFPKMNRGRSDRPTQPAMPPRPRAPARPAGSGLMIVIRASSISSGIRSRGITSTSRSSCSGASSPGSPNASSPGPWTG